jgi:hypothetical protein
MTTLKVRTVFFMAKFAGFLMLFFRRPSVRRVRRRRMDQELRWIYRKSRGIFNLLVAQVEKFFS